MTEILDGFEDGDISEWSGDTGLFAATTTAYDGTYGAETSDDSGAYITRTDTTIEPGLNEFSSYVNVNQGGTFGCFVALVFGVQSATGFSNLSGYEVNMSSTGTIELDRWDSGSSTNISSEDISGPDLSKWHQLAVTEWTDAGDITVEARYADGTTTTLSGTDDTYGAGGYGIGTSSNPYNGVQNWDYIQYDAPVPAAPTNLSASLQ